MVPDHRAARLSLDAPHERGRGRPAERVGVLPALPPDGSGRHGGDRARLPRRRVDDRAGLRRWRGRAHGTAAARAHRRPRGIPRRGPVGELPGVGDAAAGLHRVAGDAAARRLPLRAGPGALARRDRRGPARGPLETDRRASRARDARRGRPALARAPRAAPHGRDVCRHARRARRLRCRRAAVARDRVVAHRGPLGLHRHDGHVARLGRPSSRSRPGSGCRRTSSATRGGR